MKYKIKNKGISLLIAMGGSFLVLLIAFAILLSVDKMLSQMASLERSTKLFFAAESGIEAAFYHHNARGAGIDFLDIGATSDSQKIAHLSGSINAEWTVAGRSTTIGTESPIIGLLKEGQTVQIPLSWDSADSPEDIITGVDSLGGASNDYFKLEFYNDSDNMIGDEDSGEQEVFEALFGGRVLIDPNFDFGKDIVSPNEYEILIDWSVSRVDTVEGIQTFSPKENDCNIDANDEDFICENRVYSGTENLPSTEVDTSDVSDGIKEGRILPGDTSLTATIKEFMECSDSAATASNSCSKYILTFRPLLKFEDTGNGDAKIPGIPYIIRAHDGSSVSLPKQSYRVESVVSEGDFSQSVSIEIPEKTAIGAFDYVIFD